MCVSFNQAELAVTEAGSEGQPHAHSLPARTLVLGAFCDGASSGGLELGAFPLTTSYDTTDCSQARPTPLREQLWLLVPILFFFKAALLLPSVW